MLQHKSKEIISELKNYFRSNEKSIQTLFRELNAIKCLIADDFDAQIAAETIAMLHYIKEIIISLSDYLVFEPDILLRTIIADNEKLTYFLNLKSLGITA
jgi:hypothetical protein